MLWGGTAGQRTGDRPEGLLLAVETQETINRDSIQRDTLHVVTPDDRRGREAQDGRYPCDGGSTARHGGEEKQRGSTGGHV